MNGFSDDEYVVVFSQDHVYVLTSYEVSNQVATLDVLRDAERLTTETEL